MFLCYMLYLYYVLINFVLRRTVNKDTIQYMATKEVIVRKRQGYGPQYIICVKRVFLNQTINEKTSTMYSFSKWGSIEQELRMS